LTKADRLGGNRPGAGRIPDTLNSIGGPGNLGPSGLGSDFGGITSDNKVTWDAGLGALGPDNEERNKGYLDRT